MYHPRLYGEFYDMGLKYGSLLFEKAKFKLPEISSQKRAFGLASYELLKDYYPELVDEIKGFAEGIRDQPENLGAFLMSIGVLDTTGQCSVFAYKQGDSVYVGRNYDMLFQYKKFTESSLIAPKDKYAYISQSDVFIGRSDGINECGLFIAMSFVNGTTQPGIGFHIIVRKVLENCSSTQEAIQVIQATPVSSAYNFLLSDKSGDLAVVESAPEQSTVRTTRSDESFLHITNQFITPEMKPYDLGGVEWSYSEKRYNSLTERLSAMDHMDLKKTKQILSDPCICLHLKKERFGTIWSIVAELKELKIERAETKPTPGNYKAETRLNWWLNKRSDN